MNSFNQWDYVKQDEYLIYIPTGCSSTEIYGG